jgi:NAD(P)-dependent dehydrogenase (short-subunit alcohol dehydrogenase family)
MRFKDQVALITAAANGIGRATAEIMVREGAMVVAVDNNPERLDAAITSLTSGGGRAHGRLCDALDEAQVNDVVAGVVREFGSIDILVNAVGGSTIIAKPSATIEEHSLDDWERVIAFNLRGTFLFTHAVVPIMKQHKRGKIVNLASIAGRGMSVVSGSAYAAAKGGIIALTRKLSFELGPFGVNVNAIAPSLTLTERLRPHWNQRSPEAQQAQLEATPLRRVAEASDQAKVICFLASSDADFVTGLTIDVTGGQSG